MDADIQKSKSDVDPADWVDAYGDILFRYAYYRTANRHVAEDLVQETFLAALEGYARFEGNCSVRTWLTAILRHKINDHHQQKQRSSEAGDTSDFGLFENGRWKHMPAKWKKNPQDQALRREFREVFYRCISRLSTAVADAFILRELELVTPQEICSQLNISDTGLWSRLHRARLHMRQCLEKNWFGL